jgi:hypothetical protein
LPRGQKWAVELVNGWLKLFVNAERWAELMFLLTIPGNKATASRDLKKNFGTAVQLSVRGKRMVKIC